MTIPRLRPMSDTDRPEEIVVFYKGVYRKLETRGALGRHMGTPGDIGWCTNDEAEAILADLLERIKPDEPNPVYWGDEVVSSASGVTYLFIGPCVERTNSVWCEEVGSGTSRSVRRAVLTHQGKPITKFRHGLRPKEER